MEADILQVLKLLRLLAMALGVVGFVVAYALWRQRVISKSVFYWRAAALLLATVIVWLSGTVVDLAVNAPEHPAARDDTTERPPSYP
jgi:hypothetical protein